MLARISILFSLIAAAALVYLALFFLCSAFSWHILPRIFLRDPAIALHLGAALSLTAAALALICMVKDGWSRSNVRICIWSAVELLIFLFLYVCALLRV